ncbi:TonB-dependent siderophore receptor [Thalassotalea sp. M1531]|uniref:TonB-dependent siderophore receptor n=1 Tax=Thalassotalea algicola TaxID=2716224 RepID=A0A7Y0LGJ2_9GAMM|nr:TonB-dependent siderophore receptor [Thalassotalea algicola]NMP32800.1 TonB-dependent siderophore receptor [Thalassotalea algicola]
MLSTLSVYADDAKLSDLEVIEVKGTYLEGYNAHSASGASRLELDIKDIPQSVSVITESQMKDFKLNDIDSVLDTATGINVERIETDRTYYTARGFDVTNFQVDGVGLPLSSGNNHADEDTAIYDRIEVIRGANGLMTGVGNPSATVNFIRKRPTVENSFTFSGTVGSWSDKRLAFDASYNFTENTAARAVIVAQDSESYLDRYEPQKNIYYIFLQHKLTGATDVSLSYAVNDSEATGNNWGANPLFYTDGSATDYDESTNTSADWSYWDITKENAVFEISHVFDNGWNLRGTYSRKETNEDTELFYVYGTPDKTTELGLLGYASEYDNDDKHDLVDVYLTGEFELFGREHEFVVGANHSSMEGKEQSLYDFSTGAGFPIMLPLPQWNGSTPRPVFADGETGSDLERDQNAIYFTSRLNVTDDLHVTVGGRQNDWEVKGDSYGVAQDASDDEFIPYVGGVYQINEDTVAYAGYTETFISQTELDVNDSVLDPITGKSQEVGIKTSMFGNNSLVSVTYFEVKQENLAKAIANMAPDEQRYEAVDGVESAGFEIDIAGEILPGLQTSIGFTSFDVDVDSDIDANVADYTPEMLVKFAATYNVPQIEGLTLGMNIRWQDDISRMQGIVGEGFENAGEEIITKQDAYAVVGLMARYQVTEQISLSVNANNITDEKYLTSLYWAQGFYAAPANYSATFVWSL